ETGFQCTGAPSVCDGICGDGLIRGTETCDDAGANGSPAGCCSASCQIKSSGSSCDDGNACTTTDTCDGTDHCAGGPPPDCDDHNVCTADSCNTSTGCVHDAPAHNGFACDDGDACTQGDFCSAGSCISGPTGADSDGDGYCDNAETAQGCNPNDPREIPPQPTVLGGTPGGGAGNILITYAAPT